jgi:hypothetical protein
MAPQGARENLGALDAEPDTTTLDGGERCLGNADNADQKTGIVVGAHPRSSAA